MWMKLSLDLIRVVCLMEIGLVMDPPKAQPDQLSCTTMSLVAVYKIELIWVQPRIKKSI